MAPIDVNQLDKVNAIPNKTSDSVLMDGLCQEDQLYLNILMDEDSTDSGDEANSSSRRSSAWSPMMAQSPMSRMNKRMKKLRPTYAVTLSLEDISYIRPSWGTSKRIEKIEIDKTKKIANKKKTTTTTTTAKIIESDSKKGLKRSESASVDSLAAKKAKKSKMTYHCFLALLIVIVVALVAIMQLADREEYINWVQRNRVELDGRNRIVTIFAPTKDLSLRRPLLRIKFAQGVPDDLRHEDCDCATYYAQSRDRASSLNRNENNDDDDDCLACLDWALRANLRITVDKELKSRMNSRFGDGTCYQIKWQSYDSLKTPLVDCSELNEEHDWLGLGDLQASGSWPLNRMQFNLTPLTTDLSSEFSQIERGDRDNSDQNNDNRTAGGRMKLGSHVELALINTAGIYLGNLRSDFVPSMSLTKNPRTGKKELCLSASCTDKCGQIWSRDDKIEQYRYLNNIFEYTICTNSDWINLVSFRYSHNRANCQNVSEFDCPNDQDKRRPKSTEETVPAATADSRLQQQVAKEIEATATRQDQDLSRTKSLILNNDTTLPQQIHGADLGPPSPPIIRPAGGVGLIERTIFVTSQEFMPNLDGQTLRQHVDFIVKLGLKTSPIIHIDTRWETFIGSLKLNSVRFPKARLLFDILHNKGFKIILSIKPYIDTAIGISNINQLLETDRLYAASYKRTAHIGHDHHQAVNGSGVSMPSAEHHVIRRRLSYFKFHEQTITLERDFNTEKTPYLCRCRESLENYCGLVDVTKARNRQWLVDKIKRSSLLTQEADAIWVGGAHPDGFQWDDHYRLGFAKLIDDLFYKENLYVIPQWTGNFGYIQLAPRPCDWSGLRSTVSSVLTLGLMGYSLVHPGSVWGDLKAPSQSNTNLPDQKSNMTMGEDTDRGQDIYLANGGSTIRLMEEPESEELYVRWLQVAVFLPILQFNDIKPIERFNLQDQVQSLVKIRKLHVIPELKKHLPPTPLIASTSTSNNNNNNGGAYANGGGGGYTASSGQQQRPQQLPLIRPTWMSSLVDSSQQIRLVGEQQFQIGPDILVAPVLNEAQRQKDIYLPNGFWHDELRQTNLRGGKWLRNYPIELNEIAWFTRAKR